MEHRITGVREGSIAAEMGIEPGDALLAINGTGVRDILDYKTFMAEENLLLLVRGGEGLCEYEVEKEAGEDLGLDFSEATLDRLRKCRNRCLFCFIDQLPPGMRESLYLKDDDYRLSLLHGNYISLTNLSRADLRRILSERVSPLYISIHTTNPGLRRKMLGTSRAGNILADLTALRDGGIGFHGQIVLCPGLNDGEELEQTLRDLAALSPALLSLSLVPVGLTGHRDSLFPLRAFTREESREVIERCRRWQARCRESMDTGLVYAADEFYLAAGLPVPPEEDYDGYPQLENGVGLIRLLAEEYRENRQRLPRKLEKTREISLACGTLAAAALEPVAAELNAVKNLKARLYPVENRFFGGGVTVTGLLTGHDLLEGLRGKPLGEELFLDEVMLKNGRELFLDGLTLGGVREALQVKITPVAGICRLLDLIAGFNPPGRKGGAR